MQLHQRRISFANEENARWNQLIHCDVWSTKYPLGWTKPGIIRRPNQWTSQERNKHSQRTQRST